MSTEFPLPDIRTEDGKPWHPEWMDEPAFKRDFAVHMRRWKRIQRATGWMQRIPVLGQLTFVFWNSLLDEGPRGLRPRWGALTFSFLNDGFKPTLWHTWYQVTHANDARYSGIYVDGAPASLAEAERLERQYAAARARPELEIQL